MNKINLIRLNSNELDGNKLDLIELYSNNSTKLTKDNKYKVNINRIYINNICLKIYNEYNKYFIKWCNDNNFNGYNNDILYKNFDEFSYNMVIYNIRYNFKDNNIKNVIELDDAINICEYNFRDKCILNISEYNLDNCNIININITDEYNLYNGNIIDENIIIDVNVINIYKINLERLNVNIIECDNMNRMNVLNVVLYLDKY